MEIMQLQHKWANELWKLYDCDPPDANNINFLQLEIFCAQQFEIQINSFQWNKMMAAKQYILDVSLELQNTNAAGCFVTKQIVHIHLEFIHKWIFDWICYASWFICLLLVVIDSKRVRPG